MGNDNRTIALVFNALVDKLEQDSSQGQTVDTTEPHIVFFDLSQAAVETIEEQIRYDMPSGISDELSDQIFDERVENAKAYRLRSSLKGRSLEDVTLMLYYRPDDDPQVDARVDWLIDQLPRTSGIFAIRTGENGENWIDPIRTLMLPQESLQTTP